MVSAVNLGKRTLYEPLQIEGKWVEIQPLNQSNLHRPGPTLEYLDTTNSLSPPEVGRLGAPRFHPFFLTRQLTAKSRSLTKNFKNE